MRIDLNSDVGESFGAYTIGHDAGLMTSITSANVAAGFHGGDPTVLRNTIRLAKQHGVAVDVRRGSPTFARWVAVTLSADNFRQCYIPPGFAHGFSVASPLAQVEYKCTDLYDPADEIGIAWNDQSFGIHWPIDAPILSERDRRNPTLAEVMAVLPEWRHVTPPTR